MFQLSFSSASFLLLIFLFFFFNDTATTEIYTLSLHDALPISIHTAMRYSVFAGGKRMRPILCLETARIFSSDLSPALHPACARSEEHTSELQSHSDLVCRLLLEKKKKK